MEPISHSDFTFAIIGSWTDIVFILCIVYFAVKLLKWRSRGLQHFYLIVIVVVLVLLLSKVLL